LKNLVDLKTFWKFEGRKKLCWRKTWKKTLTLYFLKVEEMMGKILGGRVLGRQRRGGKNFWTTWPQQRVPKIDKKTDARRFSKTRIVTSPGYDFWNRPENRARTEKQFKYFCCIFFTSHINNYGYICKFFRDKWRDHAKNEHTFCLVC